MNKITQDFYSVKMHNYMYKVYFVNDDRIKEEYRKDGTHLEAGAALFGITVFSEQKIFINDNSTHDRKISTLMHEITHALINSYCISIDDEEDIANFVGEYGRDIHNIATSIMKEHYGEED